MENNNTLQTIFDGIEDGIFGINPEYEIFIANKAVLTIFGKKDIQSVIGEYCYKALYGRSEICDNCPAIKTFKDGFSQQCKTSIERDKKLKLLIKSTFPIQHKDNNVIQVVECIKDITSIEGQFQHSDQLVETGKLAVAIAHEIRNPLGSVKAAAQFCIDKHEPTKEIRKHLNIIIRNSNKVNKVIKDLLNLAKPQKPSFKVNSVNSVINSVCNLVHSKCLKQRVRLSKRIQKRLPKIFMDEKLLTSAFLNFIFNSLDAMPKGGVIVITSYYNSNSQMITINVMDSGCGIPEDNLKKIFDPYFTTRKDGTGMGLSTAREIIDLHKGKIHIKSKPDYGTEVTIRLPIYKGEM